MKERLNRLYCVEIYVLLDKFKAYGPKIVVKGTPNIICICGDEVQHIRDLAGGYAWAHLHTEYLLGTTTNI